MNEILISVIIPVYNSERYVQETLQSVLNQTIPDFEIIVVDDGSTDNLQSLILEAVKSDARIRYLYQENQGVSAARNFGYQNCSGQFIAFLDADDVWLPDNLEEKIKKFQADDFGLVHSDAFLINESSLKTNKILQGNEGNLLNLMLTWESTQIPGPSSILIKREVIEAIGVFDTNLSTSADHDFFLRVAARFKIGRVKKITWMYRVHSNNMHKNIALMEHDVLLVYNKAVQAGFFYNKRFKNRCFSTMYLILAASWVGDGKKKMRGLFFIMLAIWQEPLSIGRLVKKLMKYIKNRD